MSLESDSVQLSRSRPGYTASGWGFVYEISNWGRTLASEKPRIFALIIGAIGSVMGIMFFVYANSKDESLKSNWYWTMVIFLILFLLVMIYGFLPIMLGFIPSTIRDAVKDQKIRKLATVCQRLQEQNDSE